MKRISRIFSALTLLLVTNTMLASTNNPQYAIVLDCGSSGTRIHEYELNSDPSAQTFTEVNATNNKVSGGLSSFIDDGSKDDDHNGVNCKALTKQITSLLANWSLTQTIQPNTPVYIYATAGLRLVRPNAATETLNITAETIENTLHIQPQKVDPKVISGNDEAYYDWLGNNIDQLYSKEKTSGVLDLGGASFEVAFNDNSTSTQPKNHHTFSFNGHPYNIVTLSLLGEGEDQAMATMNGYYDNNRSVCYPYGVWSKEATGYNQNVNYDFSSCVTNTEQFLSQNVKDYKEIQQLILKDAADERWIAISGFYYTTQYFGADSVINLEARATNYDGKSWQEVKNQETKKTNPNPLSYLQKYDFTAAYASGLLKTILGDYTSNVTFSNGGDWAAGVAFDKLNHLSS